MVQKKRRSPSDRWKSSCLKEFELLTGSIWELRFGTIEKFNVPELFVGDADNANLAKLR